MPSLPHLHSFSFFSLQNPAFDSFVPTNSFQKPPPEYHWKDITLKRGPSQAEISRQMWATVMTGSGTFLLSFLWVLDSFLPLSDILSVFTTTLLTPKKSPTSKGRKPSSATFSSTPSSRRKSKTPSYDIGEDWSHFNEEREKEKIKIVSPSLSLLSLSSLSLSLFHFFSLCCLSLSENGPCENLNKL
jgi:hypothetical protein